MGLPWICGRDRQTQIQETMCHLGVKRERGSGGGRRKQNGFLWAAPRANGLLVRTTSGLEMRDEGQEQQIQQKVMR